MKNLLLLVYVSSFLIAYLPTKTEAVDCVSLPSNGELEGMLLTLEGFCPGEEPPGMITISDDPHYTCQVQGTTDGTFQELSVIVQYSTDIPATEKIRQFEVMCLQVNNIIRWEQVQYSLDCFDDTTFDSMNNEVRQNCSSCTGSADNDYHCEACHPDCNLGLMRCTGDTSADCCVAFYNDTCSPDFNFQCSSSPCNNGTCMGRFDGYDCYCIDGFTGDNCNINIDDCAEDPCFNGTCIDEVADYRCDCFDGYEGQNCTDDIDECADNPCLNGGTCIDLVAGYKCICDDRFTDENCSTMIDDCNTRICINGATCIETMNGTTDCVCTYGYEGMNCEDDINECTFNNPCKNGATCINMEPGYECICPGGYLGTTCESMMDNCSPNPCMNNGSCVNMGDDYMCVECGLGFTGDNCSTNIDDCAENPCVYGTCEDLIADYSCNCFNGFEGVNCSMNINDCANNPCENGGTCTDAVANYTCTCIVGFTGTNCSTNIDDCTDNLCENGGTCNDGVNEYTCTCMASYSGTNCEIKLGTYEQCTAICSQMRLFERDLCLFYCQSEQWKEEMESLGIMLPEIEMGDDSLSNADRWRKAIDDRQLYYEEWIEFAEEQELMIFDMGNETTENSLISEWQSEVMSDGRELWREYALERNDDVDFMNFRTDEITEGLTTEELSAIYANISKEWSSDFEVYKTKLK